MKKLLVALLGFGLVLGASAQEIEIFGQEGNCFFGDVDRAGNIELFDQDGNYYYGEVGPR